MPDYLTHTLSVLQGINSLGQSNANIEATQQLTQLHSAQTEALQKEMAAEEQSRKILSQYYQTTTAKDTSESGAPPNGVDDVGKSMVEGYKREQQSAATLRQAATAIMSSPYGDIKEARRFLEDADKADAKARDGMTRYANYKVEQRGEMASAAASLADDQSNLPDVLNQIRKIDPKVLNNPGFDRDPTNAQIVAGPGTKRTLDAVYKQNLTPTQRETLNRDMVNERNKIEERAQAAAREKLAEKREDRVTAQLQAGQEDRAALLRAQTDAATALAEERKAKTEAARSKMDRLTSIASKPATAAMKKSAMDDVRATFKDSVFDSTIDAFASDVADRANKIKADEANAHTDISMDDARERAIDELSKYVKDKASGGVDLPLLGHMGGKTEKSYIRGKPVTEEKPTAATSSALALPAAEKDLIKNKVYQTRKGPAKWNGTAFEAQ